MVNFVLPIWVLHEGGECFLAFTAVELIGQYLVRHGTGSVRIDRIEDDQALMLVVNDLQRAGQVSMRLNIDQNGLGGELLLTDSILANIRQRQQLPDRATQLGLKRSA